MKCLVCHMDAIQQTVEGVEIDLCVNCGGVWLDGGELETLTGHDLKNYRQLMCPECNLIMLTRTIGTVEVDHCFKCGGTWLDKGELQAISDLSKEGGAVKEDFNKFSSGVGRTRNVEIAKKSMNKDIKLKGGMVDEIFVMYKDGVLITCSTKKVDQEGGINEDILAGTLMTIQDFIEVSFGKMGESGLKEIKFGDREILIERGDNIITAVIASGDIPENFTESVQEVIGQIEERYKVPLADWDGNLSNLVGVQEMLTSLLKDSKGGEEPAEQQPQARQEQAPQATEGQHGASQEPAQEGQAEAPAQEEEAEAPAQEEEGEAPAQEEEGEAPAQEAESEAPSEEAESETPAQDGGSEAPAQEANSEPEPQEAESETPVQETGSDAPAQESDSEPEPQEADSEPET